jgi:antitoxin component YwqK of YwqJK toxin-antitoxin module
MNLIYKLSQDPKKRILEEVDYVNDREHGLFKWFDKKGILIKYVNYVNGYRDGWLYELNKNTGELVQKIKYIKNIPMITL